jgi:signal transduction histidine kinase
MPTLGEESDICNSVSPGEPAATIHAQLVTFAHGNPSPLFILSADAALIYCNHAARRNQEDMGITSGDILTLLPVQFPEVVQDCLTSDAKPRRIENEVCGRWFGWTAYRLPHSKVVYFFGADITKYKDAEKEQNHMRLRLIQSDKMASIGQLSAGIAHEINNPLSFVLLNFNHIADYCTGLLALASRYVELETWARASLVPPNPALLEDLQQLRQRVDLEEALGELPCLLEESKDGAERIRSIVQNLK